MGSVVRAIVAAQGGEVTLRGLSNASLTGKVSADGTKIDKYTFAPGAEVLDVGDNRGAVIYPSRLAGLKLDSGKVRWYALNPQGEIESMILNNVTGDAYQYGVLTRLDEQGDGMSKFYSYEYDLGGVSYSLPGTTTRFRVNVGPIQIVGDPSNPERMYSLTSTKAGQLAGGQFIAGNQKFTLSDNVLVYEQRDNRYYLSSLNRAVGKNPYRLV